jgi:hypothetical protein
MQDLDDRKNKMGEIDKSSDGTYEDGHPSPKRAKLDRSKDKLYS